MTTVLFVDHETRLSGGELDLVDLVRGLQEVAGDSLELHAALPGPGPLAEALGRLGVTVHFVAMGDTLRGRSRWDLAGRPWTALKDLPSAVTTARELSALVRRVSPDVVHTNSLKAHVLAVPGAKLTRKHLVWHVRDIIDPGPLLRALRGVGRAADRLVCISEATAAPLRSARLCSRIRVVYNGVRPATPTEDDVAAVRARIGAGPRDVVVGIVGQIAHWKGQDLFVEAARSLLPVFPQARFVVVGECLFEGNESRYAQSTQRRFESFGAGGRTFWYGPARPVEPVIAAFDVMVHASRKPEPFGRVVVEGMALGPAVVASAEGAGPEIVSPGTGLVVRPAVDSLVGALRTLVADGDFRRKLAEGGRARSKHFDIATTAKGVMAVWEELGVIGIPGGKTLEVVE